MAGLPAAVVSAVVLATTQPAPALAKQQPDLVVADAKIAGTGRCGAGQTVLAGEVFVRNIGKGRGQFFTTRDMLRIEVAGHPALGRGFKFVNSMRPGDVQRVEVAMVAPGPIRGPVALEITITVDPRNTFEEADERNNQRTISVRLRCEDGARRPN